MKFIDGYEGKYSVHKDGKVWSHIRNIFLKQDLRGNYYAVKLGKYGKKISVHRIVASAFIENVENKPEVNHKNGNKLDNRVENLEWVTRVENQIHAQMNGLQNIRCYPVFRRQKISEHEIKNVCENFKLGKSVIELAKDYKVTRGAIYAILRNNNITRRLYELQ